MHALLESPDAAASASTVSPLRTRATLLFRLRDWNDRQTWHEFYALYERYVYRFARGAGMTHHEAEDLVQDVFVRVADRIGEFETRAQRGSFRRWLGNLVRWRIADVRRRQRRRPGESGASAAPFEAFSETLPAELQTEAREEARWEAEWRARLVETALQRLARQVAPEHLQVFQLHRQQGWSLVRIARELGIGLANVYAINSRLTKRLRVEVDRLAGGLD